MWDKLFEVMSTVVVALAWVLWKTATLGNRGIRWMAVRAAGKVMKIAAAADTNVAMATPNAPAASAPVADKRNGLVIGIAPHQFAIADRILVCQFPGNWSVTLRVYSKEGIVKRTLRCSAQDIVGQMRNTYLKEVFDLPAVQLANNSLEAILRDTEKVGGDLIIKLYAELGTPKMYALVNEPSQEGVELEGVHQAQLSIPPAEAVATPKTVATQPVAAVARKPKAVAGIVAKCGGVQLPDSNGKVFEVQLETGDPEPAVFRGAALAEIFSQKGFSIGDRVRITSLGRQPISFPDKNTGETKTVQKNMFEVERAEA